MEKLKMHSPDLIEANIARLAELFPNCVTEAQDDKGELKRRLDFDLLRQELSSSIVEGPQERYQLNWPGKREALLTANAPIAKTLRPCREESVDFDTTRNLFIEGDNLDALKLLQETYLNQVKMIYIDPPYNKDADVLYKDDFSLTSGDYLLRSNQMDTSGSHLVSNKESNGRFHSDWLTMMYARLKIASNFLSDDGIIFVSIDSREVSNLRIVLDDVFGSRNFIGVFPTIMNLKGNNDAFAYADTHEFTLVFSKNRDACSVNKLQLDEEALDDWETDNIGQFKRADTLRRTGQDASRERRPNGWFPVFIDALGGIYVTEDDKPRSESDVTIWPRNDDGDELSWTWSKKKIREESYNLIVVEGRSGKNIYKKQRPGLGDLPTSKPKSVIYKPEYSSSNGTAEVAGLFSGKKVFDSPPKPRALIRDFLLVGANKDSLVMDFFAGTATTAHAVMHQNMLDGGTRRFIVVQIDEKCRPNSEADTAGYHSIADIAKERIRRAGKKMMQDNADKPGIENLDIGFRALKIDTSNMKEVYYTPDAVTQEALPGLIDNIREDRTPEDLLFQVLLDWGVDLALPISQQTIAGKTVFFVDGNALAACFDTGIDEDFVKLLAAHKPLRVVFRDAGFAGDSVKINVEQLFKLLSPATEIKTL